MKARRAIRRALEIQRDGIGFSFVEILSPCPTIWGMDPVPARKWVAEHMIPVFPLPGALLLPRGQMPLNIFEPRYLAMVDDALRDGHRLILRKS